MSQPGVADVSTTMPPVCPSQRVFEAAVRSGDSLELQRLLEGRHGKFNVNFYDDDGQTALHQVCDVSDSGDNKRVVHIVTYTHSSLTPSWAVHGMLSNAVA